MEFILSYYFSDYLFKCKLTAMRSLQYCCLMIPVKNRELLQVLLKFMVRLLDNHALSLSDDLPTKEKVIKIDGNVLSFKFLSQISLYNITHES